MPLAFADAPIPLQDPVVRQARPNVENDKLAGYLTDPWTEWFNRLSGQVSASPFVVNDITALTQSASIAATDLSPGGLLAGRYRLTYYARITRAATTSSTLTVTLSWTESGVSLSLAGAAMTGNAITTVQSNSIMIVSDAASPIRYATTYGSVGGVTMQYRLDVVLEQVKA